MSPSPSRLRMAGTAAIFLCIVLLAVIRAVQLTVVQGESLRLLAERQQYQEVSLAPERGAILDRNGKPLALTVETASIFMRPAEFRATPEAIRSLAGVLDLDVAAIEEKRGRKAPFVWLKRRVPRIEQEAVARLGLPGIGAERSARRVYPHGVLAGALLGFTGIDGNGLEGVERQFEAELQGEAAAVVVERDAHGRRMLTEGIWRPVARHGARVELTIDAALQHAAEIELERTVAEFRAAGGGVVALDPHTGEVLAMAQVAPFNPNRLDRNRPELWRNRAVTDAFEPGSTIKPFVAAAAIEANLARPDERLYGENGRYAVGRRAIRDHERYGWLTLTEAVQHSSNICLAKIGERLGRERLGTALRGFGFGAVTGIDLPGEAPGLFRPIEDWGRIHVVTNSFGQGMAVTLLQLARAFGALANGGRLMRPYVLKRVVALDGSVRRAGRPQVVGQPIGPETARVVSEMLELVVEGGTGTKARIEGIRVAGKTGTAQKVEPGTGRYSDRDRISSFVGYAPADAPRILIAVMVDTPRTSTYGGTVAAPLFRRIAEQALEAMGMGNRAIRPFPDAAEAMGPVRPIALGGQPADPGVPDLVGLGVRDAAVELQRAGLRASVDGWGIVIRQDPPPGTDIEVGTTVRLQLGAVLQ